MTKKMTLIDKAFMLKKTSLFGGLDLNLLLPIADKLGSLDFEPKEMVFHIGDEGSRIYFIVQGKIEILDKNKLSLAHLSHNDFFGDESIFNELPRGYTAISQTATRTLTLSRMHLLTIISESPNVALDLLKLYSSSIHFRPRQQEGNL